MRARTVLAAVAVLVAGGLAVASCRREPPPEQRLVVVDGLEITLAEVAPYVAFLDSFLPEIGHKTKVQRVLDDHVIPLRLAQRAFGEQRRQLRERAEALRAVAGNVVELEQQSHLIVEKRRSNLSRQTAHLPVAMFAFDPLQVGSVSAPLELPHGFFVVGVFDLHESPGLMVDDYVDALQVGFVTHPSKDWMQYYNDEKRRLADKATFVHPDYVHALPAWLSAPR